MMLRSPAIGLYSRAQSFLHSEGDLAKTGHRTSSGRLGGCGCRCSRLAVLPKPAASTLIRVLVSGPPPPQCECGGARRTLQARAGTRRHELYRSAYARPRVAVPRLATSAKDARRSRLHYRRASLAGSSKKRHKPKNKYDATRARHHVKRCLLGDRRIFFACSL